MLKAAGPRDKGLRVFQGIGMYLRPGRKGYVIPDLAVIEEAARDHRLPHNCYPPGFFQLVAEVTSANWRVDMNDKVTAYATAGVPVYVIVDRERDRVLVLSRPHEGTYHGRVEFLRGEKVEIPGPLPCEIADDELLQG